MTRTRIVEIIACLLIALFVYAGMAKLFDYQKFTVQIGQSPMLTQWAGLLGWTVPVIELVISILLAFERSRLVGLYSSLTLLIMFTVYIVLATRFSDFVPCSCGGIIEQMNWSQHLLFNAIFVVLTGIGIVIDIPAKSYSKI